MTKVTKELLQKEYWKNKKSTRKIASELKIGKTTIEYYLKKFNIKRRTLSQANKLHAKESNWIRGLSKKSSKRVENLSKKIKKTYINKRKQRIKKIEERFGKKLKEIIFDLYWNKGLNQEQIAKEVGYDRSIIIGFMNDFNIERRPKYQYISSLKGETHSMYGKKWEELCGKENAEKRKKIYAERFRKLTIKRLEKNEFPFFDTKIERIMAKELVKRKFCFVKQFRVQDKYVCDFAIPCFKIIIECDGDYWHANPKIYDYKKLTLAQKNKIKTDKAKDIFLKKEGWCVLRFFESDIKSNIRLCIDKIEETIQKIRSPIDSL